LQIRMEAHVSDGETGRRPRRAGTKAGAETQPRFYADRLESARRAFASDAKMADALGVDRAQVKRWREGRTEPGPGNAERVVGLDAAVELLTGYLEPASIGKWLLGHNAHLGERRPVDLLREGNLSEVTAAIEALKSGAYA
jgi:DNA-binding transcriptional regulator YiaG